MEMYIVSFMLGGLFGVFLMCLMVAGRSED